MTPFYVIGGLTAAWAVVLAAIGIRRHGFPSGRGATRAVMAISIVLALASVSAAIVGGILEAGEHAEAEAAESEAEAAEAEPLPGAEELSLAADPTGELAFEPPKLEAQAGPVVLVMENPAPIEHNVSLEGQGVSEEGEVVGEGGTSTVSAEVESGEYTFYCSVAGHREGGMEGTLTVK